jgi:hypothetical protein
LAGNVVTDDFSVNEKTEQTTVNVERTNIWNHSKLNLQYAKGRITNRMGVEYIFNPFRETYQLKEVGEKYKINIDNELASVYNDTKIFLTNNLTANIGLRGEYSAYLEKYNFAPRLYLAYRLNSGHILSASAGEYFQLPSMDYLKLNERLDFTSVNKATVSYGYVKDGSKFQLDAYYKQYKDLITYDRGGYYPENVANKGKGYGWGADVFYKNNFKRLEYWLTYSYNQTKKQYGYFPKRVAPAYVAENSLNVTLKYWLNSLKSMLGVNNNFSSGLPYYAELAPYSKLGKTPNHNRLDISWSYLPTSWIVVHFGCQNVLGRKNIYGYEYSQVHPDVRQEISNPQKRFFFVGVFITLSKDKKLYELKNL